MDDVVWWGIAGVAACTAALLAGSAGQGAWAAAAACLALAAVAVQQVRLLAARRELKSLRVDSEIVFRSLSGGLLTLDLEGRVTSFNPAAERILGLHANELRGRTLAETFGERAPLLHDKLLRSLQDGTPIHRFELEVAQPGGGTLPIGLSTSLLRTPEGDQRGVLATFQDLSDVRRMQERVRRADRLAAVGELSASIAHEIRNPLAAIANSIDMLRDELDVVGEQRKLMDLVVKEGERLNRILDDFLEYARLRPIESQVVPVVRALDEVATLLRRHPDVADELEIVLDDRTGGRALACIDEAQMKQVYVNLSLNAFEAMGHSGRLTITLLRCAGEEVGLSEAPYLCLSFHDTGTGIEPGQEGNIFEPFHTTKPQGTGLGLSTASRIVESHGGRIEAGNSPRGGAEFCVYLPLVIPSPERREALGPDSETQASRSRDPAPSASSTETPAVTGPRLARAEVAIGAAELHDG